MNKEIPKTFLVAIALLLVATAVGLDQTYGGLFIHFGGTFTEQAPGEIRFWLASLLLVFPAACLLGWAFQNPISNWIRNLARAIEVAGLKESKSMLTLVFCASLAFALLGNRLLLYGLPITDDEQGSLFGAKIWLSGKLMTALPEPIEAFKRQFMYFRGGLVTNMDWPGNLAAWALDRTLGLQGGVFALAAALSCTAIVILLRARLSMTWAMIGAALFWLSPMASSLSFTTHQHLLSRAAFSVLIAAFWWAKEKKSDRLWLLAGLSGGLMFTFRPIETAFLLLPFVLHLLFELKQGDERKVHFRNLMLFSSGMVPFLVGLAGYNHQITGSWWLPPRLAIPEAAEGVSTLLSLSKLWHRFGSNTGFNLFLLLIWSLGPLTLLLFLLGIGKDWLTRLLGACVLSALGLGLLHDIPGIHIVGPIHYSECVVPLLIVGVHGLERLWRGLSAIEFLRRPALSTVAAVLILWPLYFNLNQWSALHSSAKISYLIHDFVEVRLSELQHREASNQLHPSVVLGPPFLHVWQSNPDFQARGTWVYEWPTFSPDLNDTIIYADNAFESALRSTFPERDFYRLALLQQPPFLDITPVTADRRHEDSAQ